MATRNDQRAPALRAGGIAALFALAAIAPAHLRAEPAATDWKLSGTVYLWLPSLGGETTFPAGDGWSSVNVSVDTLLDSLNFAFMGALEGRKGRWGAATDVIYLDLGATRQRSRDVDLGPGNLPLSVDAKVGLDVRGWLWTTVGSYGLLSQDNLSVDALAGARLLNLQEDLHTKATGNIASLPAGVRSGTVSADRSVWDAIVGVKGRAALGAERNWFVPFYVDVGTGESDLTWQARAGLGYSFDSLEVVGVWRYLDYDLGNGAIKSIDFNGPAIGVTYRF